MSEDAFKAGVLATIPSLRAFAISLTHDFDRADDLVQDTITRAWANQNRFEAGTNLNAWLFTILRNLYYSNHRKRHREVSDPDGEYAASRLKTSPDQQAHLEFQDLQTALQHLPPDQREALLLVAAEGLSYEDAAGITGVAVGTVKSRVNRARARLAKLLQVDPDEGIGSDGLVLAALQS